MGVRIPRRTRGSPKGRHAGRREQGDRRVQTDSEEENVSEGERAYQGPAERPGGAGPTLQMNSKASRCSSVVEQLVHTQQVEGSNPSGGTGVQAGQVPGSVGGMAPLFQPTRNRGKSGNRHPTPTYNFIHIRTWCSGNTTASKSVIEGSIPSVRAELRWPRGPGHPVVSRGNVGSNPIRSA